MPKSSVSTKMLELSALYLKRVEVNVRGEAPENALFWAAMIHSLFALARQMSGDRQMHADIFAELNVHDTRAMSIIRRLGPHESAGLSGKGSNHNRVALECMLDAYGRFREEGERLGIL